MSFDFGPMKNLSNVQASSKTTAGGGGNTGYFQRGQNDEEDISIHTKEYPDDSFERTNIYLENDESFLTIIKNLIKDIFEAIKNLFAK